MILTIIDLPPLRLSSRFHQFLCSFNLLLFALFSLAMFMNEIPDVDDIVINKLCETVGDLAIAFVHSFLSV